MPNTALKFRLVLLAVSLTACAVAENHRPKVIACTAPRPASNATCSQCEATDGGAACTSDADCTAGSNGRCVAISTPGQATPVVACSYDTCTSDSDCNSSDVCLCRNPYPADEDQPNVCVGPGDCHADSDCGSGGYCSLSPGQCGWNDGVSGYFCHSSADQCFKDSDCPMGVGGSAAPFCLHDPTENRWICIASACLL